MTDATSQIPAGGKEAFRPNAERWSSPAFKRRLAARYRAQKRFELYGLGAILVAVAMLAILLTSIVSTGLPAFGQTWVKLDIAYDPEVILSGGDSEAELMRAPYIRILTAALEDAVDEDLDRRQERALRNLVSRVGGTTVLREAVLADRSIIGSDATVWVQASGDLDQYYKNGVEGRIDEDQARFVDKLDQQGRIETRFNWQFFGAGSREPELAGILPGLVGSFFTLIVTLVLTFPVGVLAAIYLEEFAPKNRFTDLIEVNINNLAAVPSIVFGLLGLAVFLNFFGLPRSAPLVGGIVLALMSLPTIIIAARAAVKAIPPSIREAALGVGASKLQTVMHHVIPLAMPGILTGTIIAMAQALGETAPLLLIGMESFITTAPAGISDAATVLPVQIYQFAGFPERGFVEKTSAAIIILLIFMITMNGLAIYLRKKFERRW